MCLSFDTAPFLELISDTYKERMHIVGFQYSPACFTFCSKTIP